MTTTTNENENENNNNNNNENNPNPPPPPPPPPPPHHHHHGDTKQQPWARERTSTSFPSWERFSAMLAAVSSRAFQIDEDIGMIPLLDLCNHSRGKGTEKMCRIASSQQHPIPSRPIPLPPALPPARAAAAAQTMSQLLDLAKR